MEISVLSNCSDNNIVSIPGCSNSGVVVAEMFSLSAIFLGSVLGNGLILLVIHRSRRSEWTTNYFVLSLGLTNLTIPFMSVLWTMIWILRGSWLFHSATCKLSLFFNFLNSGVSAGLIACLSLDRFYIIVHPLKFKMSRSQTKQLIIFVWIFMVCSAAPVLYFFESKEPITTSSNGVNFCIVDFETMAWKVYIILFFLIAFFAPLLFTFVMYSRIIYAVITRNQRAKNFPNSFRRQTFRVPHSKIKVLRMLFLQWLVFVCCCFPYFFILVLLTSTMIKVSLNFYVSLLLLCFSNSALNVAIYALFSADFRLGCKRVFCKPDSSQAYRLTSLGRKHRVAPFEFSSDHENGLDELRLPEHKPVEKPVNPRHCLRAENSNVHLTTREKQAWSMVRSNSERQSSL